MHADLLGATRARVGSSIYFMELPDELPCVRTSLSPGQARAALRGKTLLMV